ncbi:MAG: hypothetical protein JSV20_05230 [Candidatus Bathyarchaeota archaeon]|nr:MAG: hypothetical protein JSV20_05230 [Candidatus Bathyarchaeota archaeon]
MEGQLHSLLKRTVFKELEKEGYALFIEPIESPLERLWWNSYKPDLLGIMSHDNCFKIALVECETNPRKRRVIEKISKIRASLMLQTKLNEKQVIRPILTIPTVSFCRINYPEIREFWEIWIITNSGEILHKIDKKR